MSWETPDDARRSTYLNWSAVDMQKAIKACLKGEMKPNKAWKVFNVPRSTLQQRLYKAQELNLKPEAVPIQYYKQRPEWELAQQEQNSSRVSDTANIRGISMQNGPKNTKKDTGVMTESTEHLLTDCSSSSSTSCSSASSNSSSPDSLCANEPNVSKVFVTTIGRQTTNIITNMLSQDSSPATNRVPSRTPPESLDMDNGWMDSVRTKISSFISNESPPESAIKGTDPDCAPSQGLISRNALENSEETEKRKSIVNYDQPVLARLNTNPVYMRVPQQEHSQRLHKNTNQTEIAYSEGGTGFVPNPKYLSKLRKGKTIENSKDMKPKPGNVLSFGGRVPVQEVRMRNLLTNTGATIITNLPEDISDTQSGDRVPTESASFIFPKPAPTHVLEPASTQVPKRSCSLLPKSASTHVPKRARFILPKSATTHVPETSSTHVREPASTHVREPASTHIPEPASNPLPKPASSHLPNSTSPHDPILVPDDSPILVPDHLPVQDRRSPQSNQECIMTNAEETDLTNTIVIISSRLCGIDIEDIRRFTYEYSEAINLHKAFPSTYYGRKTSAKWAINFIQRNPPLKELHKNYAAILTEKALIEAFFRKLGKICKKRRLSPDRIYNTEVYAINFTERTEVVEMRGQSLRLMFPKPKSFSTFQVCVSASGRFMPPKLIFPKETTETPLVLPDGGSAELGNTGMMSAEIFMKWFKEFVRFTQPTEESPVVLLLDPRFEYLRMLGFFKQARQQHVEILCFPPMTAHILQPLDVCFVAPMRHCYAKAVQDHFKIKTPSADSTPSDAAPDSAADQSKTLTPEDMVSLFTTSYVRAATKEIGKNGFKFTGIHPFDPQQSMQDFSRYSASRRRRKSQIGFGIIENGILQPTTTQSSKTNAEDTDNGFESEIATFVAKHFSLPK